MTRFDVHVIAVDLKAARSLADEIEHRALSEPMGDGEVSCFTDGATAIRRLCDAVQKLTEGVAPNPKG